MNIFDNNYQFIKPGEPLALTIFKLVCIICFSVFLVIPLLILWFFYYLTTIAK